ncbi:Nn.00g032250.m01.CDS01 [Neocucurbitaria sp. VM-36]
MSLVSAFGEYQQLRNNEIRILELKAGEWDSPIVVSLKHILLTDPVHFEALSYVWGNGADLHPIVHEEHAHGSDGAVSRTVTATRNLRDALQHFRDPMVTQTIWADALCINQQSHRERAQQVRLMREIYMKADRVMLWLGREDENTALAVKYLEDVAGFCTERQEMSNLEKVNFMGELAEFLEVHQLPEFDEAEVAAGQEVLVAIGRYKVPFSYLGLGATWLRESQFLMTGTGAGTEGLRNASIMWQKRFASRESAADLLDDGRDLLATDPRDKVYGLLGFTALRDALSGLEPAYDKTVEEVYTEAALAIITSTKDLDVLSFAEGPPRIDDDIPRPDDDRLGWPETPSWVARWDEETWFPTSALCGLSPHKERTGPQASIEFSDAQAGILKLWGHEIDTVVYVAPYVQWPEGPKDVPRPTNPQVFATMWSAVSSHIRECTPHDILSAWAQALTGGINASYQSAQLSRTEHSAGLVAFMIDALQLKIEKEDLDLLVRDFRDLLFDAENDLPAGDHVKYQMAMCLTLTYRRIFVTARAKIGLGHSRVLKGDSVVWLHGGRLPFVLRGNREHWRFVGEAFLYDTKKKEKQEYRDGSYQSPIIFTLS